MSSSRHCLCGSQQIRPWSRLGGRFGRCKGCGTIHYFPTQLAAGHSWQEVHTTESFKVALGTRRRHQASEILSFAGELTVEQRLLDYGCGQGFLVNEGRKQGLRIFGVDLYPQTDSADVSALDAPWAVPDGPWDLIFLLDVLEHHPEPTSFIRSFETKRIVLKLPNARGPSMIAARLALLAGSSRLFERLFLVADPSPHYWIPTVKAIREFATRTESLLAKHRSISEVGRELPERVRIANSPGHSLLSVLLRTFGLMLERIGLVWSDSFLVLLVRTPRT